MRGASGESLHECSSRDAVNLGEVLALTIPFRQVECMVDLSITQPVELRESFSMVPPARDRKQSPHCGFLQRSRVDITCDVITVPGTGRLTDGVDNSLPIRRDDAESWQVVLEEVRTVPGLETFDAGLPATACRGEHHAAAVERGPVYQEA